MRKLALFCKSFSQDIERAANLCSSIEKYNSDGCPVYFAVPAEDRIEFKKRLPGFVEVVVESEFMQPDINKKLPGWREQQVAKLMFGVACSEDLYLVLDSDSEFIRPFKESDFLLESKVPLVCTKNYYRYKVGDSFSESMCLGLCAPESLLPGELKFASNQMFAIDRRMVGHKDLLSKRPSDVGGLVPAVFGRLDRRNIFFMPTPIIISRTIINHFWIFLRDQGLSFSDLILYSPWEAIWYGHYAATRFAESISFVEPYAMHFIHDQDIEAAKKAGVTKETLAKNFIAVTLAARHQDAVSF